MALLQDFDNDFLNDNRRLLQEDNSHQELLQILKDETFRIEIVDMSDQDEQVGKNFVWKII